MIKFLLFYSLGFSVFLEVYNFTLSGSSLESHNFYNEIIQKIQSGNAISVSLACQKQLELFSQDLQASGISGWAAQMIDSCAKPPSGILKGNLAWMGNFQQCLEIGNTNKTAVKGNYCLFSPLGTRDQDEKSEPNPQLRALRKLSKVKKIMSANNNDNTNTTNSGLFFTLGLCVPNKCTVTDMEILIPTGTFQCQTEEDVHQPMDTGGIIATTFFGVFAFIMAVSTTYDFCCRYFKKSPHMLLVAFSVYTNGLKIFTASKIEGELSCLNGIRVLSMAWVILGHQFTSLLSGPLVNIADVLNYLNLKSSMVLLNAPYSVDTFFVISGLLVTYVYIKAISTGQKFNIFIFYIHRYLRLTPAIAAAIIANGFLIKYMGSGPYYSMADLILGKPCRESWYYTITYFETYIRDAVECLPQVWYLNVDFQLYLLSPIALLSLSYYLPLGLGVLLIGSIASIITAYVITIQYNLQSLTFGMGNGGDDAESSQLYSRLYYLKTHTRAAAWLMGALLGYFLGKIKFQKEITFLRINKWLVFGIWIAVLATIPALVFADHDVLAPNGKPYNPHLNASYNAFARPVWALCISWVIFACANGYGGPINRFLSWSIFQILSKFTYSMYILHLSVIFIITSSLKWNVYFTMFNLAFNFLGFFVITLSVSIFWVLAFESPIIIFEKWLFGRGKRELQMDSNMTRNNIEKLPNETV